MHRESWSRLSSAAFEEVLGSGKTFTLSPSDRPAWAQDQAKFRRMWVYGLGAGEITPSLQTTASMVAKLITERFDPRDELPYNYNWYAVIESSNGGLFQSGPHRDVEFGHHLATPVSSSSVLPKGGRT